MGFFGKCLRGREAEGGVWVFGFRGVDRFFLGVWLFVFKLGVDCS